MAFGNAVFDPLVFDVGVFEGTDIIPILQKLSVERGMRRITAGSAITISAYIIQGDTTPERLYSFNPSDGVTIELYDPIGTIVQAYDTMYNVALGIFNYQYQTTAGNAKGKYTARIRAENGTKIMNTPYIGVFEII